MLASGEILDGNLRRLRLRAPDLARAVEASGLADSEVVEGPRGATVLGRGEGYAVRNNTRVEQLGSALRTLAAKKPFQGR